MDARLGALQEKRQWLQGLLVRKPEGVLDKEMRKVLRDPEFRKNIEILAARLSDAIDLDRRGSLCPKVSQRLNVVASELCNSFCLETLLDTRRWMEELLLECSDPSLLRQRTAEEYAEEETTLLTWRRLYGAELPEILSDIPECSSKRVEESTRRRLQCLVAARFSLYRPLRARRRLRKIYLCYMGPALLVAGLLFGAAIGLQSNAKVGDVLLAAAAGASGAALGGLLKFRDEVKLGAQVREFAPFYYMQVLVGVVFGLLIDLIFAAGWLKFAPGTAGIGVIAFAAGYSEPFALGIVAKVMERAAV